MNLLYLISLTVLLAFLLGCVIGAWLMRWIKHSHIEYIREANMRLAITNENLAGQVDKLETSLKAKENELKQFKSQFGKEHQDRLVAERECRRLREWTVEIG